MNGREKITTLIILKIFHIYYEMLFSSERKQAIDIHNLYGSQENWAELGVGGI